MFLVTTADQRFWKKDEKILFLGEWCKIYNQKNVWSKLDYKVLPYHWNDRGRLYQDYLHLDSVYERYLKLLAKRLNEIHHVDRSIRYWRIIIGPWLYFFIEILYDRYLSIITAIESGLATGTWIISYSIEKWIPKDIGVFNVWQVSDEYNQYLYSRIIEALGGIPFDIVNFDISPPLSKWSNSQGSFSKRVAKKFLDIYAKNLPSRWNRVVHIGSYLNTMDLIKLQLCMKQLPYPLAPAIVPKDISVKPSMRKKLILKHGMDEFEYILDWLVADQIPKAYLEGYADMHQRSLDAFPKKPKVIFTADAYQNNEGFKFWAAQMVECGAKLVGTQHGGHYGCGFWTATESHEISIYDRFYTWGWRTNSQTKTVPMPAHKLLKLRRTVKPNPKGSILWIAMSLPRYSYWMYSIPVGPQMLDYLNDQYQFARSVSPEVHELLLLRLYPHEFGWNERNRWADEDPMLMLYQGTKSMYQQLNESRLFIGSYNATTFLETFSANFPTILFWNPKHWELRPSAQRYFDKLRRVGILHDTPELAAAKVNEIYKDPYAWWNQAEIQEAKDEFCQRFALTSENWLNEWKIELSNLVKKQLENDFKTCIIR